MEAYANPLTVIIDGQLDFGFARVDFVPLRRPFSGTIRGTTEVKGVTEQSVWSESLFPGSVGFHGNGFFNITSIEDAPGDLVKVYSNEAGFYLWDLWEKGELSLDDYIQGTEFAYETSGGATGLFGIRCGDLTLENLVFRGIRPDGLSHIIAMSVDSLTMRNIEIADCSFSRSNALLAGNAGRAQMENLLVTRCNITLMTSGGGLIVWVYENAAFSRVAVMLSDIVLIPDGGGSGYAMGKTALFASYIGGEASFRQIEVYGCSMYSLNSVVLCQRYGNVTELSDITVRSSSFLRFPANEGGVVLAPIENDLLFGSMMGTYDEWAPPAGQNILLRDSMFNARGSLDDYRAIGYVIENCVSVTFVAERPRWD
jgi:hypothetical protein